MSKKGRRLKRFLGLRRDGGSALSGGIEHLMPGRITGWVVAPAPLHEVRLLVGPHLIARSEINQPRPDVCETLHWQGDPGFALTLPGELPQLDWSQPARLLALSADGNTKLELGLLQQRPQTAERLKTLLQSEALGLDGHCDGLQQGALQGWAGRRGQAQPTQIWLQASGLEPWAVRCDQWREAMQDMGLPNRCGFRVEPQELPGGWGGQKVWCSFDRAGQFHLPGAGALQLPTVDAGLIRAAAPLMHPASGSPYAATMAGAPRELEQSWQALEQFRQFLDGFEAQINRAEALQSMQKELATTQAMRKRNPLARLLGVGR